MSKNDAWMPLYIGDYLADTMHLTGPEHGAYLLLLMHYWRNGPLIDDDKVLAGIARTDRKVWEREIGPTVRTFFVAENGRLHQKRMDAERSRSGEISSKRKAAADARWSAKPQQKPSKSNANADANAFQMDTHAGTCASASPSQSQREEPSSLRSEEPSPPHTPRKRGAGRGGLLAAEVEELFSCWWVNYPRKVGRGAARKAFDAAVRKVGDPQVILDGLFMRLGDFDGRDGGRFIPHPATWLNQERWCDGDDAPPPRSAPPELPLH